MRAYASSNVYHSLATPRYAALLIRRSSLPPVMVLTSSAAACRGGQCGAQPSEVQADTDLKSFTVRHVGLYYVHVLSGTLEVKEVFGGVFVANQADDGIVRVQTLAKRFVISKKKLPGHG